jgi:hypothetical protein
MMSKSVLIAAVGTVSVLSIGTGTFLAYRANHTSTPVLETSTPALETPTATPEAPPVAEVPAPSGSSASSAVGTKQTPAASSQAEKPAIKRDKRNAVSTDSRGGAQAPAASSEPVTQPATSAATPVPAVDPPPVASTSTANATATAAATVEPPPVAEASKPRYEELTVKQDAVVGIKIDQTVSSETAHVEDRVTAKVTRDVTVDGRTAIAAGTKLEGVVSVVERGGKFRERAKVGVRFTTLILADGLRVPIQTEAILREGESPTPEAGAKIGASAVAGAIVGGLIGGKRGAVMGSTAGAAGGTAVVAAGGRNEAIIPGGSPLTVRLTAPVTVTIERELEVR